ncbi:MAG: hypothetical protein M0P72_03665 [Metallibacterium scheffleri]|uniref:hypothetical protein n=1 Tax=Metallibacterium scheffleri TaxID=993689 RepID=UPI0026E9F29A|nr:hypothetical protein [Metallibacterium scheffleri]MCK9366233.1 hypothetical protein [Metallibacterium scheffleri]
MSSERDAIRSGSQEVLLVAGSAAPCAQHAQAACVGVLIERLHLDAATPLRVGDRIVSLNGLPVRTADAFTAQLRVLARSEQAHLGVLRAGRRMDFTQAQIAPFIDLIVRQPVPPEPPLPPAPPPPPLPPLLPPPALPPLNGGTQ